jgi:hypothetical protein
MLRKIFNSAALPSYVPQNPTVLVSAVGNDKDRGDSHGYVGLGKIVAEKLGGTYHYIDDDVLRIDYPHITRSEAARAEYLREYGWPDIIFSHDPNHLFPTTDPNAVFPHINLFNERSKDGKKTYVVNNINEALARIYAGRFDLVPHHITPALLREHGQIFEQAYTDIQGPIITVMMADHNSYGLAEKLLPKLKSLPESTVFVCGGRRTDSDSYTEMMASLFSTARDLGLDKQVKILGYDFQKGRKDGAYNPYLGLIDRSEHIILYGDSKSILSETLSRGRALYVYNFCKFDMPASLLRSGAVRNFDKVARHEPLTSPPVNVKNTTEHVANKIVGQYCKHLRREMGFWRGLGAYVLQG